MTDINNAPTKGAKWYRTALQVNPYSYIGRRSPSNIWPSEDEYNHQFVEECKKLDIKIIAITDHWNIESSKSLRDELTNENIVVLPAFEANSSEGIHLLIIFPEETPDARITAAIGQCGATPRQQGTGKKSYDDIIKDMTEAGAIAIPAHANVPDNSLLIAATGQSLEHKIKNPNIYAIGITPTKPAAKNQKQILKNQGNYKRTHPLAEIHADDVNSPKDLESEGATTWFKMEKPSFSGLKFALQSPQTRVSLEAPDPIDRTIIKSIKWEKGYLDNVEIEFSTDLNTLIGGRGAGKSTVLESLRFALQLEPLSDALKRDHNSQITGVLGEGTKVTVRLYSHHFKSNYTIIREVGEDPKVFDEKDQQIELPAKDVAKNISIFGQHEISEISTEYQQITEMLVKMYGIDDQLQKIHDSIKELEDNRAKILKVNSDIESKKEKLYSDALIEEGLKAFEKTKAIEHASKKQKYRSEENRLRKILQIIKDIEGKFPQIPNDLDRLSKPEPVEAESKDAQNEIETSVKQFNSKLKCLNDEFHNLVQKTIDDLSKSEDTLVNSWQLTIEEANNSLMQLKEHGINIEAYDDYLSQKQQNSDIREEIRQMEQKRDRLKDNRRLLHETLLNNIKDRRKELGKLCNIATSDLKGIISLQPHPDPIQGMVLEHLGDCWRGGQKGKIENYINSSAFDIQKFQLALEDNVQELKNYDITDNQLKKLETVAAELSLRLDECYQLPFIHTFLLLKTSRGVSDRRSMQQLSKGQRATALLLLLMVEQNSVLIIDQPEDDLDNRFVHDEIVQRIRQLKGTRQLILSTHNANIPVLGDSELVVCLQGTGNSGEIVEGGLGSIDVNEVKEHASRILEGGYEAFEKRRFLYGF